MSEAPVETWPGSRGSRLEYAEALNKIQFEHTLIHMSWLFTSQGFFTAAYFALKSSAFSNLRNASDYSFLLAVSAAIIASMFYWSILAAHLAMRVWRTRAEEHRRDALISKFLIHYFGDAPASTISLIFVAFWGSLILQDLNLYNLHGLAGLYLIGATVAVAAFIWFLVTWSKFRIGPPPADQG